MLPKYHLISGILFSGILYWLFNLNIFQAGLIFLASFLIDFDHYVWYIQRKKDYNLKNAYFFLKKLSDNPKKPIMMIFHTIEFHILIFLLGYVWAGFFYMFIGMIFHSVFDLLYFGYKNIIYIREYSLIRFLILKRKNPGKYF